MGWFPGTNTGRFVGGVWLLSSLIVAVVYKSNLKAMLIIPKVGMTTSFGCKKPNNCVVFVSYI